MSPRSLHKTLIAYKSRTKKVSLRRRRKKRFLPGAKVSLETFLSKKGGLKKNNEKAYYIRAQPFPIHDLMALEFKGKKNHIYTKPPAESSCNKIFPEIPKVRRDGMLELQKKIKKKYLKKSMPFGQHSPFQPAMKTVSSSSAYEENTILMYPKHASSLPIKAPVPRKMFPGPIMQPSI